MTVYLKKIRSLSICLLLFLPSAFLSAEEMILSDLSGGLYSYPSSNRIPDNACSDLQNFYTDIEKMAVERNGFNKRDSTVLGATKSVPGLWEFIDTSGNEWQISFSSRTFYKNQNGQTPTAFGPLTTVNQVPSCTVNLGKFWCTDGTDSGWYFDGSSTAAVAGMPLGKLITSWRTRLVVANITSAQTTLRFSADGDGTSWTLAGNPTDPFSLQIGGANDGFKVNCLWKSYQDNLIVGRKRDLWAVAGFDQSDVEVRNISSEVGCIEPNSIRENDGSLMFLSWRGLEEMVGFTIRQVSEPVRNITDAIVRNSSADKSNTQTSNTDWGAGTITPAGNLAISGGDLLSKTTSWTQTTQVDWSTGPTLTGVAAYIDTETVSGNLQTTFPDPFDSYRDGTSGTKNVWTKWAASSSLPTASVAGNTLTISKSDCGSGGIRTSSVLDTFAKGTTYYTKINSISSGTSFSLCLSTRPLTTGTGACSSGNYFSFSVCSDGALGSILDDNGDVMRNCSCGSTCGTGTTFPADVFVYISTSNYQLKVGANSTAGSHTWTDKAVYAYTAVAGCSASPATTGLTKFGVFPEGFSYASPSFDTGISTPVWGTFSGTWSKGDGKDSLTFTTQVSTSSTATFATAVSVTTGSTITSAAKEFLKTNATFTVGVASGAAALSLSDFSLTAGATGTYQSPILDLGTAITSFQTFTANQQLNGGTITHEICTSANSNMSPKNCASPQALNALITASVNRYAQTNSTFSITAATQAPTLNDYTISWTEGNTPPLASWTYDRRYWLAYTTSTASGSYNDHVLVYQRNKTFTLFSGINAASFALFRDALHFGNSIGNGYVYKFDYNGDDDGTAITSVINTKSYDLGQFIREKDLRTLYVDYNGNTGFSGSFSMYYDLDRSGSSYSLGSIGMNEGTGSVMAKVPFVLSNPVQGREFQYQFTKTGGDRLKIYEFRTIFDYKEPR